MVHPPPAFCLLHVSLKCVLASESGEITAPSLQGQENTYEVLSTVRYTFNLTSDTHTTLYQTEGLCKDSKLVGSRERGSPTH